MKKRPTNCFAKHLLLILINFVSLSAVFGNKAEAFVSISTTLSGGVYRDSAQKQHVPVYLNWNYTGLHSQGLETAFDLYLNNDFASNEWKVLPAQATVTIPLSSGFETQVFRKSRLVLGRQLLMEGFDLGLLDGVQSPIYWSQTGGVWLFAGTLQSIDLGEVPSLPTVGGSVFEKVLGFFLRAGYSARQDSLKDQRSYLSFARTWEDLVLSPSLSWKSEWNLNRGFFSQSASELSLTPHKDWVFALGHSLREPRPLKTPDASYLYRLLSLSPQESSQARLSWQWAELSSFNLLVRQMRFQSGVSTTDWGQQQEASIDWELGAGELLTPSFSHVWSYGGELWDGGLRFQKGLTDKVDWQAEAASTYLTKINSIQGWAHHLRSGLQFHLGPRWLATTWVELERNHVFEFDLRALGYVTYVQ